MEIGIDEIDDDFEIVDTTTQDNEFYEHLDDSNNESVQDSTQDYNNEDDDFIPALLKTRGIEDKSKIKIENDEGEIEEVDWDSLSNDTKLNILNSSSEDTGLDDKEIELINVIRSSNLSPAEYIQAIQQNTINQYIQQQQNQNPVYKVDEISDEELYIMDLIARIPDMTNDEAIELLEKAKQNNSLFTRQIGAIRAEYKKAEDESIQYNELLQQQEAQEQFNQFAKNIERSINDFTEFAGYDLNMEEDDMYELYDFITGFDSAGNSHFGKALNDPRTLVRMAWFALYGEQMINDINDYYKKEITNVRKESFNKGAQSKKDKTTIVHKPVQRNNKSDIFDDFE